MCGCHLWRSYGFREALWSEILFVTMALNDFARLYAAKKSSKSYDMMLNKHNIWDGSLGIVSKMCKSSKGI